MSFDFSGAEAYHEDMNSALAQRQVADLSAKELHDAWEWRLVEEGLDAAREGRKREVTPAYFEELRARIDVIKQKTR